MRMEQATRGEAFSPAGQRHDSKQVLAGAVSSKQVRSAETLFSCRNSMSTEFDEFWNQWVLRYDCSKILYNKWDDAIQKKYNEQNLSDISILWVISFKKLCFSQVSECSSLCQRKLNVHSNWTLVYREYRRMKYYVLWKVSLPSVHLTQQQYCEYFWHNSCVSSFFRTKFHSEVCTILLDTGHYKRILIQYYFLKRDIFVEKLHWLNNNNNNRQ